MKSSVLLEIPVDLMMDTAYLLHHYRIPAMLSDSDQVQGTIELSIEFDGSNTSHMKIRDKIKGMIREYRNYLSGNTVTDFNEH